MNRTSTLIVSVVVLALVAGGIFLFVRNKDEQVVTPVPIGGPPNENPTQNTDVQKIIIKKEWFDPDRIANKDLELAVGDVYSKFTVSRIVDSVRGSNWIYFSGEETLRGILQLSAFDGSFYFIADSNEAYKLPQVLKDLYENPPRIVRTLAINEPPLIPREGFIIKDGNSNPLPVEIKISNLILGVPSIGASSGSAKLIKITFLDK